MKQEVVDNIQHRALVAFVMTLVGGLVLGVVTLISYPFYKTITASGQVDYCYIETYAYHAPSQADVVTYDLYGFRSWRLDRKLTQNLKNLDEVREAATKYGCTLR